jgi:hypothetical protein
VQPSKTFSFIALSTEPVAKETVARLVHPLKAPPQILVSEAGSAMPVRLVHFQNASWPILVTDEYSNETLVSPVHPSNVPDPMLLSLVGSATLVSPVHP